MTNRTPIYTRAELEAALRLGEGTALGIHITILSAKNKYMRIDEIAARILAAHIGNVERRLTSDVEMEGLHHLWQHRGWSDAVKLLRGEDLP